MTEGSDRQIQPGTNFRAWLLPVMTNLYIKVKSRLCRGRKQRQRLLWDYIQEGFAA
jgi:DNA-directed RNA polymerase specialized sigma24 family protein